MTVKSRRSSSSPSATRAALIKTARKLFARLGYADTDIETVASARASPVARYTTISRTSEDLFSAVFDLEEQRLAQIGRAAAGAAIGLALGRDAGRHATRSSTHASTPPCNASC